MGGKTDEKKELFFYCILLGERPLYILCPIFSSGEEQDGKNRDGMKSSRRGKDCLMKV